MADVVDPFFWAKKPKSQVALELVKTGAQRGDPRMVEIFDGHIRDRVCNAEGVLLLAWRDGKWIKPLSVISNKGKAA